MQVSISKAAKMVGIKSRSTFYRHIDKKGISVSEGPDGNPRIDVSELIRVYGDRVKLPAEKSSDKTSQDTNKTKQVVQDHTPVIKQGQGGATSDIAVLKERIHGLETIQALSNAEREKEKRMLSDQIETLKSALEQSQEQQKRLTLLLTDQREGQGGPKEQEDIRYKTLENLINALTKENKRLTEIEAQRQQRIEARRQALRKKAEQEQQAKQEEQSRGFFKRLLG